MMQSYLLSYVNNDEVGRASFDTDITFWAGNGLSGSGAADAETDVQFPTPKPS